MQIITELHCFGNIKYWVDIVQAESLLIEKQERFQKSGYRNRYEILSATGPLLLTIPVSGGRETNDLITETTIKHTEPWQQQHWRALESCYNHAPFFQHYAERLKPLYDAQQTNLFDWNVTAMHWVAQQLRYSLDVSFTESFSKEQPDGITDNRNKYRPGNRMWAGQSFSRYIQVFGDGFHPNLCILDALFNLGTTTMGYLLDQKAF